ncbi:ABC transporter substrate-binding protein [Actinomadura sp. 3N508]|uniref:ABC transporter substrate-binding protein n=1 Tax=Actinomadura sp. 3N508 TaxID=3375153 RepID=UPI00378CE68A
MRKKTLVTVTAALALLATACGSGERGGAGGGIGAPAPAGAASGPSNAACSGTTLKSTDIGITADKITIEMIGDTGSTAIPGLANGAVEAVKAWADMLNKQGGLACRKVEVRTYDSKLSPDEARNGYVDACQKTFAAVGTTALSVADVTPLTDCVDKNGAKTGLPEVPGLTILPVHTCNPTSFPMYGSGVPCPVAAGARDVEVPKAVGSFMKQQLGGGAQHGLYLVPTTAAAYSQAVISQIRNLEQTYGLAADIEAGANGKDPQSAYTPAATTMRDKKSTFGYNASTWPSFLLLQKEAAVQGATPKMWYCVGACYDPAYTKAGGKVTAGTYVQISNIPYEEAGQNPEIKEFTTRVKEVNTFAQSAWVSARLFQQAVEDTVKASGPNGLTRASLLKALAAVKDFDNRGMVSKSTPSAKLPAECIVIVQAQDGGGFKRIHPQQPGTMRCEGFDKINIDVATAFKG